MQASPDSPEHSASIARALERLERNERDGGWPPRWSELDKRTIEFVARLNEEERRNLIYFANLSPDERARAEMVFKLDTPVLEAGIRLAKRSASWARFTKRFPAIVLGLAGFILASKTIWETVLPWIKALLEGAKP